MDLAPDDCQGADNLVGLLLLIPDGHVVSQLGYTFMGKKSRDQNVGVGQIELADTLLLELWLNLEAAALLVVEQSCKYRGRVEIGKAEKID